MNRRKHLLPSRRREQRRILFFCRAPSGKDSLPRARAVLPENLDRAGLLLPLLGLQERLAPVKEDLDRVAASPVSVAKEADPVAVDSAVEEGWRGNR